MNPINKNAPLTGHGQEGAFEATTNKRLHDNKIRRNTKLHRVISRLAEGYRLNRFQAERICFDHVLPSTIAAFQSEYNIPVSRELVTVPGHGGSRVTVAEYWLDAAALDAASKLLEVSHAE